jgi:hypothetical protein
LLFEHAAQLAVTRHVVPIHPHPSPPPAPCTTRPGLGWWPCAGMHQPQHNSSVYGPDVRCSEGCGCSTYAILVRDRPPNEFVWQIDPTKLEAGDVRPADQPETQVTPVVTNAAVRARGVRCPIYRCVCVCICTHVSFRYCTSTVRWSIRRAVLHLDVGGQVLRDMREL